MDFERALLITVHNLVQRLPSEWRAIVQIIYIRD